MSNKAGWRRVLYEQQPYADNFVDEHKFLEQLELTTPVVTVPFSEILLTASIIAEEINAMSLFLTTYKYLVKLNSSAFLLIQIDCSLLILGYALHRIFDNYEIPGYSLSFQYLVVFGGYLRVVSPILQSLTSSYSEDTIHACTLFFSAVHLLFQDYSYLNGGIGKFSGTLSLNAAMFTAVLLASRLDSIQKASGFLLLAVILFCLLPHTIRIVKKKSIAAHLLMTFSLWIVVTVLLFQLDKTLLFAYELAVFFFAVICPFWLKHFGSKYKKSLRGPWDIAQVQEMDKDD